MSKMSQLHAELSQQAYDLGYESLEQALENGWCVDYEEERLYKRIDIQEEAHKAWLEEKDKLVRNAEELLDDTKNYEPSAQEALANMVRSLIEFIKACHD